MKGIPYKVATIGELPECWVWKNRQYVHKNALRFRLPTVKIEYEGILKELGISYRIIRNVSGEEVCEYWDSATGKEDSRRLPVYVRMENGYRYVGKYHTDNKVTYSTFESAAKLTSQVKDAIKAFKKEKFFGNVKEQLGERQAIAFYDETFICPVELDYVCGEDRIKAIPVVIPEHSGGVKRTYWYACFNANKIELNSDVKLEKTPREKAGLFIGTKAWQVKEWCRKLGVKHIEVVAI